MHVGRISREGLVAASVRLADVVTAAAVAAVAAPAAVAAAAHPTGSIAAAGERENGLGDPDVRVGQPIAQLGEPPQAACKELASVTVVPPQQLQGLRDRQAALRLPPDSRNRSKSGREQRLLR